MGEVYRAEDMRMGQQVALKFLPDEFSRDAAKLERLFGEVRIGRQVSHPNVCRIYDLVECDGHVFLSMEYIDGEDLASLLRRIGRLPDAKALAVAREVAAGLAAAHALGVVHRDLKPANVMIDGRGVARITDFGLAVVADEALTREIAGTPAYMSPEQLAAGVVTHRSDLYAMGALLYELFTGKRLFDGATAGAIRSSQSSGAQSAIRDTASIDPAVQKLILRCLERDPARRPSSIHAFIAALPGADPLQAAIDAGETPSPEMLAAAGESGELRPAIAWPLLIITLLLIAAAFVMSSRANFPSFVRLPLTRDVLAFRAQEFLRSFAGVAPPQDSFGRFSVRTDTLEERRPFAKSMREVLQIRPVSAAFYYRQSPRTMIWSGPDLERTPTDPPFNRPGMAEATLDPDGHLVRFAVIGPDTAQPSTANVDWAPAFDAAGVDPTSIHAVAPLWTPPVGSDRRFAWTATLAGQPNVAMRVEGASLAGKPVWFDLIPPWKKPQPAAPPQTGVAGRIMSSMAGVLHFALLIVAVVLGRRNLIAGRADTKLATRLALLVIVLSLGGVALHMDHLASASSEMSRLMRVLGDAVFEGVRIWIVYVALEPYLRRRWPRSLIAWKRLFDGRLTDALLGREVLVGLLLAMVGAMLILAPHALWPAQYGTIPVQPAALEGPLHFFELLVLGFTMSTTMALFAALVLLVSHVVVRNRIAAVAVASILYGLSIGGLSFTKAPLVIAFTALTVGSLVVVTIARRGVLTAIVALLGVPLIVAAPATLDVNDWFFWRGLVFALILVALAIVAFVRSVGTQPLFSGAILEE